MGLRTTPERKDDDTEHDRATSQETRTDGRKAKDKQDVETSMRSKRDQCRSGRRDSLVPREPEQVTT